MNPPAGMTVVHYTRTPLSPLNLRCLDTCVALMLSIYSRYFLDWATNAQGKNPASGSLIGLVTEGGETTLQVQE